MSTQEVELAASAEPLGASGWRLVGHTRYATDNLRVALLPSRSGRGPDVAGGSVLAGVVAENLRDVLARVDATQSYLVTTDGRREPLFLGDRVLPGGAQPRVLEPASRVVRWLSRSDHRAGGDVAQLRTAGQRVRLCVIWEDGRRENVDLTFRLERPPQRVRSQRADF